LPAVVDGDGIAESVDPRGSYGTLAGRTAPTVLTPHDGEFAAIGGDADSADRLSATRDLAAKTGCTVLRKGPTTIVATAGHPTYLVVSGDERLATAGSGDVLSGIIGAFLARGVEAPEAAAAGAFVHGMAGSSLAVEGAIARDVVSMVSDVLSDIMGEGRR
jgi:NAD(P)H-hydrate repair Nnr-like enzyme with NAD(P)H-hydrate dehydratase domain